MKEGQETKQHKTKMCTHLRQKLDSPREELMLLTELSGLIVEEGNYKNYILVALSRHYKPSCILYV